MMNKTMLKDYLKKSLHNIVAFLYPSLCPFCLSVIDTDEYACKECKSDMPPYGVFQGVNDGYRCCSPLVYDGKFRNALILFKFKRKKQYTKAFARIMYEQVQKSYPDYVFDYITYVPMHRKDKKKRGFNQSQLLAKELSKLMNIGCFSTLVKIKQTTPQHKLEGKERRTNLRGAFKIIDKSLINGRHILIVDDVVTTGSTLYECSKTLEKGKPSQICCATLLSTAHLY